MSTSEHNSKANSYGPYEFPLGDELRGERATLGKTLLDVQRDLRIRAAYIAAIEDAKPEVFPNPSFIAGYVRSYARYLGLDPDEVFHRFCQESGFAAGPGQAPGRASGGRVQPLPGGFVPNFPLTRQQAGALPEIPFSAVGSLLVLAMLVAGLGYGGWMVLQNIQRVQFAPVEELPVAVAEVDALDAPEAAPADEPALGDLVKPVSATALADLYRQQELEVPILVPRDGPIAALDPDRTGLLASYARPQDLVEKVTANKMTAEIPASLVEADATAEVQGPMPDPQVTAAVETPRLVVVAERAAWIRVYLANGTIIFERILEKGETYTPPEGVGAPLIWAGNAGSVYVKVGDALHGPLGSGTKAVRDVVLDPKAIVERYARVADIPEVISQSTAGAQIEPAGEVALR
jgi:cytoskeletal protein RodZ